MTTDITRASSRSSLVRRWRHDLHERPETGFGEQLTSDYVADVLEKIGLEATRGVGGTGVVATLQLGTGPAAIGLRADMDGLPLHERGARPYRSRHDGVMHACGHDGHVAMVLGTAARLAAEGGSDVRLDGRLDGTVHFVFQPAEEHGLGAKAMLADGLLDRFPMDAIYGLHNLPGVPAGPLVAGTELVGALQTIVARSVDPTQPAVVSCTEFLTDGARNAIPGEVVIRGDTRSFDPPVAALVEDRIRALAAGICAAHGATCTVSYTHEFEPTVNDAACTAVAVRAAVAAVGAERADQKCLPFLGSEDFGAFTRAVLAPTGATS